MHTYTMKRPILMLLYNLIHKLWPCQVQEEKVIISTHMAEKVAAFPVDVDIPRMEKQLLVVDLTSN